MLNRSVPHIWREEAVVAIYCQTITKEVEGIHKRVTAHWVLNVVGLSDENFFSTLSLSPAYPKGRMLIDAVSYVSWIIFSL